MSDQALAPIRCATCPEIGPESVDHIRLKDGTRMWVCSRCRAKGWALYGDIEKGNVIPIHTWSKRRGTEPRAIEAVSTQAGLL